MGLISRILGIDAMIAKSNTTTPAPWFVNWLSGNAGPTLSGIEVTSETAMRLAAVWACVRMRSEDIGKMPLFLYQVDPKTGEKKRAYDHPLLTLIRDQPNPYQTALEFRQLMQAWVDLRGNAFALKDYNAGGQITALWPVNPKWVQVLYIPGTWEVFYRLTIPYREIETIPAEALLHVRGFSLDGFTGVNPIIYHKETVGSGIAAEHYGAAFFGNSAQPQGALKVPHTLSADAGKKLRADWESKHRGVDNAKKLAILDGGMDWVQMGLDNVSSQYLETRRFTNEQIYSIYRVPAHKAGDLTRATNNNIEQMALEYVSDCLMTEMVRWEQCLKRDCLTDTEKLRYYFEFLADALLRGDTQSRYAAYAQARQWGILSVNEIRDKENLNRIPNGDIYLTPMNMQPAGTPPAPKPAPSGDGEKPTDVGEPPTTGPGGGKDLLLEADPPHLLPAPHVPQTKDDGDSS